MAGSKVEFRAEFHSAGPICHLIDQMNRLEQFRKRRQKQFEELTDREVEVLTLVAGGMKNPAIARELGISRATVQNHRSSLRDKLNIQSQADFITYAVAYDLIEL
jgi:DNA-binding NarL/FixJ family response regulator